MSDLKLIHELCYGYPGFEYYLMKEYNSFPERFNVPGVDPSALLLLYKDKKIYSENGEDGITLAIFNRIGVTNRTYLEFGATTGHNNGQILEVAYGFKGVLWNGSPMTCPYAEIHQEFVSVENIKELCLKYSVNPEPDFCSIDIDGNDWHVWRELNKVCRPRVVVIEHFSQFGPFEDKVMPYNPDHVWDGTDYAGASIQAFYLLARRMGYSLVAVDSLGVNLFFVRDDLNPLKYFLGTNDIKLLYRIPGYGYPHRFGHPRDTLNRPFDTATRLLHLD